MKQKSKYTLEDALKDLGGKPSESELLRLVDHYPSYKLPRRQHIPFYLFEHAYDDEVVEIRRAIMSKDNNNSGRSIGGDKTYVKEKRRKAVKRLLYLRKRIDEELTHEDAIDYLTNYFYDNPLAYREKDKRKAIRYSIEIKFASVE